MERLQECHNKIAELCLRVLGNMSLNHDGKQECIDHKVIERSYTYLIAGKERSYNDALNTSLILMSCSIHLEGKNQIISAVTEEGSDDEIFSCILKAIINRLKKQEYHALRGNLKITLENVAEKPDGFATITLLLIKKIEILDEVFGYRAVKPLHNFLPEMKCYDKYLELDEPEEYFKGQYVVKALSYFFKKYQEDAAQVAIVETVNFAERLAPWINPNLDSIKEVFSCLYEILPMDPNQCHVLNQWL
jgi:hypothetical protein